MPFTPFHMGPALLVKSVAGRRFSVLVFGVSQVCIDIEPLVRIVRGDPVLHGLTHTFGGAAVIGTVAAVIGRPFANWLLGALSRETEAAWAQSLLTPKVSLQVALSSAWLGTFSHLLLDGIMHADMQPFAPFTSENPLLHVIGVGTLHVLCVASGVVGIAIIATRAALARNKAR